MDESITLDQRTMDRALELAARGQGCVEPNPMVGCVILNDNQIVGEGWHAVFGKPHAEVIALHAAGPRAHGGTLYVTLEPCCHHGKTPPCVDAIMRAGIRRVVIAQRDPFSAVNGNGITALESAGITCVVGIQAAEAGQLLAPYLKLVTTGRPWIIAKWAMTMDGRIATRTGDSRWISGPKSRNIVHQLRGRVDGIVVGRGTAEVDDPLLTARPEKVEDVIRTATRIVVDSSCQLSPESQLVKTSGTAPLLIATSDTAPEVKCQALSEAGAEIFPCQGHSRREQTDSLLKELARRRMTNVLVEGGGRLFGELFDLRAIDEVHVFIAPKIVGGMDAVPPVAGLGVEKIVEALSFIEFETERIDQDLYLRGRLAR
jgi:diaminohydroxyphosphoribosylaminopyrimidine deaminase/5-amino-6-(5-phosphoribosylamino)uracil reductase